MKQFYHNPRPYMTSTEIHISKSAYGCSVGFGNPSGHSSLASTYYMILFLLAFHDQDPPTDEEIHHFITVNDEDK